MDSVPKDNRIKRNEHYFLHNRDSPLGLRHQARRDKHITITSGKKAEAKEIYEKIKKRLILDNNLNI